MFVGDNNLIQYPEQLLPYVSKLTEMSPYFSFSEEYHWCEHNVKNNNINHLTSSALKKVNKHFTYIDQINK